MTSVVEINSAGIKINLLRGSVDNESECLESLIEIVEAGTGRMLFCLRPDGTTTASEGFVLDEAAKAFWAGIFTAFQYSEFLDENIKKFEKSDANQAK